MLLDRLLTYIAPHECLACSAEGRFICTRCLPLLRPVVSRCYRCRRITTNARTCIACRNSSSLFAVFAATTYDGIAKDIVWQLKFNGARAAAHEIAEQMVANLSPDASALIVPVPTASSRSRARGYDQAILLSKAVARQTGMRYASALRRLGQHHQVGANRQQRITQLADAYRVVKPHALQGRHIILVDDVLTTGATLEAAARVIRAAGAKRVSALVFAQA